MSNQEITEIPGLNLADLRLKGVKVHAIPASTEVPVRAGRRDFYKMGLVTGDMTVDYGGQLVDIKGTALFFVNPNIPHSLVRRIDRTSGYACIFTETFLSGRELQDSPLFRAGGNPVVPLNAEQAGFMTSLFKKMLAVYHSDYIHKADLIRNGISLIIHEALRIQPTPHVLPLKTVQAVLPICSAIFWKDSSPSNAATNRLHCAVRRIMPASLPYMSTT